MIEKVHISSSDMATFICPKCEKTKTVDVSKYARITQSVRVKSTCPCGHTWTSVLEKRRQYRKDVNFAGKYVLIVDGNEVDKGVMVVSNLSTTGIQLKLNVRRKFNIDDLLRVEFNLDDARRTHIVKDVIVKNQEGLLVGCAFSLTQPQQERALGFYLMS